MLLVFVDETSDRKFKNYLGFCVATLNHRSYPLIKRQAQAILADVNWDPTTEFKGSYLFSKSKGCTDVEVESRVDAAHKLLDLNIAKKNSRLRFYYGGMKSLDHTADYLKALPALIYKALPKSPKGPGKNLVSVFCDERSDVPSVKLHAALQPAIEANGYVLLENVMPLRSNFDTVGIMFADLVCYLRGRVDTIGNDVELFEGLSDEQLQINGKIRKLKSSTELIEKIKKLDVYVHSYQPAA